MNEMLTPYERRKKRDPEFLAKRAKAKRERYARNKHDTEWVRQQNNWRKRKALKDPEWAEREKDKKKQWRQAVQNDPEKREHRNALAREWRKRHPGRCKEYDRKKWEVNRHKNPLAYILHGAKASAKDKGLAFDITQDDLQIPTTCPVLGIPIAPFLGMKNPGCASIDRIDSTKGYVKGNVRIISWLANRLKSNCNDAAIFRAIADDIERHLNT